MKRVLCIVFVLLLTLPLLCAAAETPYIRDEAGILSENELVTLEDAAKLISSKHGIDVAVVIIESLDGEYEMYYADDYYDMHFGEDGVLLLYSVGDDIRYVSTCGDCIDAIDNKLSDISAAISDPFYNGNHAEGIRAYIETVDSLMASHKTKGLVISIAVSIVIGFVVALIVTGSMKARLDGAKHNERAEAYVNKDSLKINVSRDLFLYRTVSRTAKPKNNSSTHSSSSGRTHGGGRV